MGSLYRISEAQNSGTGSNMQFSSHLSPCYLIPTAGRPSSHRDGDITWTSRNGCNALIQSSSFDPYQIYEKEIIRQAMLNHEASFRYQVHELHRLYKRQNELMAEHRMREVAAHQFEVQRSQSDWLVNSVRPDISQKTVPPWSLANPEGCAPFLPGERYLQRPQFAGYSLQSDNNSFLTKRIPADNEGLHPKINKFGKRMIDLELPGDLYIDSDEEDNSICCKSIVDVPPTLSSLVKETPEFHLESDRPNTFDTTSSLDINSSCGGTKFCIDLNESIQPDDESYSSSHLKSSTCSTQTVHLSPVTSRKPVKESKASDGDNVLNVVSLVEKQVEHQPLNSEAVSDEVILVQNSSAEGTTLGSNISCESHDSPKTFGSCISRSPQLVSYSVDLDIKALSSVTSKRRPHSDSREVPLAIQALPCFNTTKVTKGPKSAYSTSRNHSGKLMVKKTSANNADIGKQPFQAHMHRAKRMKNSHDRELLESVDLNCMPLDFETLPGIDWDLKDLSIEAPVSPQNSECHPPRGESDTFDIPLYLPKEDELNVGELDRIAAEAIWFMSSSQGTKIPEPSEPLINCLNWFAGIASSCSGDICDAIKELSDQAADSDNQVLGSFRGTNLETRKVRVKRTKDASCRRKKQNEKEAPEECLPRLQGLRRRSNKPKVLKQKYLHAIEMDRGTDFAFDSVKRRKRNTGTSFAKRRPRITITGCDGLELSVHSSPICNVKEQTVGNSLHKWGSGTGRRKARRARRVFDVFRHALSHTHS